MHYTGTIWRPPYEASSLLLEVTAGCTHHGCKFCTLYSDLPAPFKLSPMAHVEGDLQEAQAQLELWGQRHKVRRTFLTGGNPFVLHPQRLLDIAARIKHHFPQNETIGCFARVTDVARKTDGELEALRGLGYAGLSIGVETGDGPSLEFMDKGYGPGDIVEQSRRLDGAGIAYHFMYLAGLPGAGRGVEGAVNSAEIFNRTHPRIIGSSMLTVFPESRLHEEMRRGTWTEESEIEKLEEIRTLVKRLEIPVWFATLGASNAVWVQGELPAGREAMLAQLEAACDPAREAALRRYRTSLPHL